MEAENNACIISITEDVKKLLPVDRVSHIAATVLFDPKHLKGNCFDNVKSYLFPVKSGSLTFIVTNKKEGEKYLLSEILAQKQELQDTPIYRFFFVDEENTMTMVIENEGDKTKRPIGIIEGHAVVLDTNCVYTKNCKVPFQDIEVGMFKWFKETAKKVSDLTDETFGSAEENLAKLKEFSKTVVKDDPTKSFTERLLIQQKENFQGMKYEEKISKVASKIIDNSRKEPVLEKFVNTQLKNYEDLKEVVKTVVPLVEKEVIGDERSLESFKKQQIKNFKSMEYGKKLQYFYPVKEFKSISESKLEPFMKNFSKKIFTYEDLEEIALAFPKDINLEGEYYIKNPLVKINFTCEGKTYLLRPQVQGLMLELKHYQTIPDNTEIYSLEGDWFSVAACDVTVTEMQRVLALQREEEEILAFKFELEANRLKQLRFNRYKKVMCHNIMLAATTQKVLKELKIKVACNRKIEEIIKKKELEQLEIANKEAEKKRAEAIYRQKLIDQEEFERKELNKMKQLEKIKKVEEENAKRHREAEVLPFHLKKILTSFVKKDEDLAKFGLEYRYEGKINRGCVDDPKQYKTFFYETSNGWMLNLNDPRVEEVQMQDGNAYIATS